MNTDQCDRQAIVVRNVSMVFTNPGKDRADVAALQNIDFVVPRSQIICLVGPSGCGKSTLLNIIAGFEKPTAGEVLVSQRPVAGPGPDRGVVFQAPSMFPWLTVYENIVFGPKKRGVNKKIYEKDAGEFLEAIGLASFARYYPYELSGGMKQRVAIARALINNPQVLLMDEPFGALDAQTRLLMQELLLSLWLKYRPTILFITHDVDEAIFLADHIYVMSRRPGTISFGQDVPFNKPRTYDIFATADFINLKRQIMSVLRGEGAH